MGFLSNEKSPRQIIIEEEGEIAEEIWKLIEGEKADLEKIMELERNSSNEGDIRRAENALNSLAVMIDDDLDTIAEQEEQIEEQLKTVDLENAPESWSKPVSFEKAAEHNLELVERVTEILFEENSNFEQWLESVEREENMQEEVRELLEIEQQVEQDLEKSAEIMKNGGRQFQNGWISLS